MAENPESQAVPVGEDKQQALQTSFFIMPGNALKSLRDELSISTGERQSEGILYRYGIRCGEGMIARMNIDCEDMLAVSEMLPGLWAGIGLGRIQLQDVSEEGMAVLFKESVESRTVGVANEASCHFTRGYLSGMASALAKRRINCMEEECVSKGDTYCIHRLTLTKEDVVPAKEEAAAGGAFRYQLETGTAYMVKEDTPTLSYNLLVDRVSHGGQGLCITRDFPDKVRKKHGLVKTPIIWLSNAESEFAIEPVQLGKLYHKIEDFLKKSQEGVVLLTGIEYVITQNNYNSALKFLQLIRDQISIHNAILICPISPSTLNEKDLKMIERELTVFEAPHEGR